MKTKAFLNKCKLYIKSEVKGFNFLNLIGLTLAGIINSIGVCLFLTPGNVYDGGFSGTSILLDNLTNHFLGLAFFLLIINIPFYILGLKKMGFKFVLYSVYAIGIYSLCAYLIQNVIPFDFSIGSPIVGHDIFLCSIFGGLLSGIGSGLVIRFEGALDGIDVVAILVHKKLNITVGTFDMCFNVCLFIISAIIFKSWYIPLYSIVAYAIGIKTVDFIIYGLDKSKAAFIITEHGEDLAKELSSLLGRGVTLLDGRGYYSDETKNVIYVVVNRFEMVKVKEIVNRLDSSAFVSISDVTETLGSKVGRTKRKK
ncbi:MAG: YitT family protein [Bacilli bacterium]